MPGASRLRINALDLDDREHVAATTHLGVARRLDEGAGVKKDEPKAAPPESLVIRRAPSRRAGCHGISRQQPGSKFGACAGHAAGARCSSTWSKHERQAAPVVACYRSAGWLRHDPCRDKFEATTMSTVADGRFRDAGERQ